MIFNQPALADTDIFFQVGVVINIGRPSFLVEVDFQVWNEIFEYIENCNLKISTNGIYEYMCICCRDKLEYLGGGFKFEFGLENFSACDQFEHDLNTIWARYFPGETLVSHFCRRPTAVWLQAPEKVPVSENTI